MQAGMVEGSRDERLRTTPSKTYSLTLSGFARYTLGIVLLLTTVFLWTASQFLASTIFADNTYSKPYFVTYVNSSFFTLILIPAVIKHFLFPGGTWRSVFLRQKIAASYARLDEGEHETFPVKNTRGGASEDDQDRSLNSSSPNAHFAGTGPSVGPTCAPGQGAMNIREIAWLSFEFSILWANYSVAACLEYTSVASSTILTATSSIWTLLIGASIGVEEFTLKKLVGVIASFAGVVLTSTVDISGESDKNRGSFPHKSPKEIGIGDALALSSAVLYGVYTTVMKKRIGDESRVNMPLFFGFVGLFNTIILLPGFPILHLTGVEPFVLPPTKRVWEIILVN
ncbi:MAG: hypothetical protein Q9183_000381 [Haloplaca sp. 2 TL-2023]